MTNHAEKGLVFGPTGRELRVLRATVRPWLVSEASVVGACIVAPMHLDIEGGGRINALKVVVGLDNAAFVVEGYKPAYALYWCRYLERFAVIEVER